MAPLAPRVSVSSAPQGDGPVDGRRLIESLGGLLGADRIVALGNGDGAGTARRATIEGTDALLAVIGPGWQPADDAFTTDVRLALEAHVPVIPVLTHRAELPDRDELPEGMRPLLARHPRCTIEIPADPVWDVMSAHLAGWLREIAREAAKRADARAAAARKRAKLEADVHRAEQQLAAARSATDDANRRRREADDELVAARASLAERERGLDPARTDAALRVFVSYRADAGGHALTLQTELQERLGADRVSGTDAIAATAEDAAGIAARIGRCDVVLAIIGPHWMGPRGGTVDVPDDDPARLEVGAALARGIPVVPVLTPDAELTAADPLPENLEPIRATKALPLSVQFWDTAVDGIVARLAEIESALRSRIEAITAAAGRVRSCEDRAQRAARDVERGGSEIHKIERQLEDGREKVRRASDEEARLKDEQPDQNAVYLRGPGPVRSGRSRGPAARVPSSLPGVDSLSPRVLGWIAAAVIVLVIIIIAAGH